MTIIQNKKPPSAPVPTKKAVAPKPLPPKTVQAPVPKKAPAPTKATARLDKAPTMVTIAKPQVLQSQVSYVPAAKTTTQVAVSYQTPVLIQKTASSDNVQIMNALPPGKKIEVEGGNVTLPTQATQKAADSMIAKESGHGLLAVGIGAAALAGLYFWRRQ
jgi:hypothetical protein